MTILPWYLELSEKRSFGYYTSRNNPKRAHLTQNGLNMTISQNALNWLKNADFSTIQAST